MEGRMSSRRRRLEDRCYRDVLSAYAGHKHYLLYTNSFGYYKILDDWQDLHRCLALYVDDYYFSYI
jgi:hypothetical protein